MHVSAVYGTNNLVNNGKMDLRGAVPLNIQSISNFGLMKGGDLTAGKIMNCGSINFQGKIQADRLEVSHDGVMISRVLTVMDPAPMVLPQSKK